MLNELLIAIIFSVCMTTLMYGLALFFKKRWKINHPKNIYLIYLIVLLTAASIFPFASIAFSTSSSENIVTELGLTDMQARSVSESTIITTNQNVTYASSITPLDQTIMEKHEGKEQYLQKITWNELVILEDYTIKDKKVITEEPILDNPIDTSNLLQKNLVTINKNRIQTPTLINQIVTNLFIQQETTAEPILEETIGNEETIVREKDDYMSSTFIRMSDYVMYAFSALALISLFYILSSLLLTRKRILNRLQATTCTDKSVLDLIRSLSKEFNINSPKVYEYQGPPNAFVFGYPISLAFSIELKQYLSQKEFEAAMRHELVHIKHHDILIKPFLMGLRIFFFYNPIVHVVSHHMMKNREILADMATFPSKQERISLMEALIKINEYTDPAFIPKGTLALLSYKAKKLSLTERFSNLFEKTTKKTLLTAMVALIVILANASIFFVAGSIVDHEELGDEDGAYTQEFSIDKSYYSQSVTYTKVKKNSEIRFAMIIQRSLYNIISTTSSSIDMDDESMPSLFSPVTFVANKDMDKRPF